MSCKGGKRSDAFNHKCQPDAISESRFEHLYQHMRWQPVFATRVVRRAEQCGLIRNQAGVLLLTERGQQMARQSLLATTGADMTFVEGKR